MREFFRVLKPGGWAILQVPVSRMLETTYEDARITDPREREKEFGQHDHVWIYGSDYKSRLEEAGFSVFIRNVLREFGADAARRYALMGDDDIYFCIKPAI